MSDKTSPRLHGIPPAISPPLAAVRYRIEIVQKSKAGYVREANPTVPDSEVGYNSIQSYYRICCALEFIFVYQYTCWGLALVMRLNFTY